MPQDIRVWKIEAGDALRSIEKARLNLEGRLESWLCKDISILSDDLIVIGRQVRTDFGGEIDLLCLDRSGDTAIVELKRDKTPREVVAQTLDYASWVSDLSNEELVGIANSYLKDGGPLDKAFERRFKQELPENLNADHHLLIVASELDASSERIIKYLSEKGVAINAASFQYLKDGVDSEFLARVFLVDPQQVKGSGKGHQYDDIDQFMKSVRDKLPGYLIPGIPLPRSSRWAGRDGTKRYFCYWYDGTPWNYDSFCFGTELEADERSQVSIEFYIDLKSAGIPEKTMAAVLGIMKKRDKEHGFDFSERNYANLEKVVQANELSPGQAENVAKELGWLISSLMPEIKQALISTTP